jgi:hypothetical protein
MLIAYFQKVALLSLRKLHGIIYVSVILKETQDTSPVPDTFIPPLEDVPLFLIHAIGTRTQ